LPVYKSRVENFKSLTQIYNFFCLADEAASYKAEIILDKRVIK
jgi:hypothetical protein